MDSVVNLNRFRKAKQKRDRQRQAAENRVAFGRTKAARREGEIEREKRQRELAGKRLEQRDE